MCMWDQEERKYEREWRGNCSINGQNPSKRLLLYTRAFSSAWPRSDLFPSCQGTEWDSCSEGQLQHGALLRYFSLCMAFKAELPSNQTVCDFLLYLLLLFHRLIGSSLDITISCINNFTDFIFLEFIPMYKGSYACMV